LLCRGAPQPPGATLLDEFLGFWRTGAEGDGNAYTDFLSPGLVLGAMGAVCLFSSLPVKGWVEKLVAAFAPAALGVYLWHVHPLTWYQVFSPLLPKMATYGWKWLTVYAMGWAGAIFLCCLLLEKVRLLLSGAIKKLLSRT
ncbi:MAG: hypothetical protein K2F83_06955, partial [Oscillospiraceae bacterium]|nr:hypothetical protein [Oscillospiraceae bacterium]